MSEIQEDTIDLASPAEALLAAHCAEQGLTDEDYAELMMIVEACAGATDTAVAIETTIVESSAFANGQTIADWASMALIPCLALFSPLTVEMVKASRRHFIPASYLVHWAGMTTACLDAAAPCVC